MNNRLLIETIELQDMSEFTSLDYYIDYLESVRTHIVDEYNDRSDLLVQPSQRPPTSDCTEYDLKVFVSEPQGEVDKLSSLKVGLVVVVYREGNHLVNVGSILSIDGEYVTMNDHRDNCRSYCPTYKHHYSKVVVSEHQWWLNEIN